jgi:hypothetical protein
MAVFPVIIKGVDVEIFKIVLWFTSLKKRYPPEEQPEPALFKLPMEKLLMKFVPQAEEVWLQVPARRTALRAFTLP